MPAPLSMDLRERIVRAVEGGSSMREVVPCFAVSASAAIKLMRRCARRAVLCRRRCPAIARRRWPGTSTTLVQVVEATPDITLAELRAELQRRLGPSPALSTLHRTLHSLGLRHRRSP